MPVIVRHRYLWVVSVAIILTNCNRAVDTDLVGNLPLPLLMQKDTVGAPRIVRMDEDRTIVNLGEGIAPRWSPDGTQIAFWANTPDGLNEIFIMNSDGSFVRNLTNTPARYEQRPVWSPDGSMIAYDDEVLGGGKSLGIMNVDGTNRHFVQSDAYTNYAVWFPDGQSLLFQRVVGSRIEIQRVSKDGTGDTTMTFDTAMTCANGRVSSNGLYFSYSRGGISTGTYTELVIRDLTNGKEDEYPGAIVGSFWSPESDWLYCTDISPGGHMMFRINPKNKMKQDLSRKPVGMSYDDGVLALSSDGQWLAFSSNRTGSTLVYMTPAVGGYQEQITTDPHYRGVMWKP
jgi:Tol biopolymer transport system component